MLSFKDTQTSKPLFDYYVETDLDSFDDQPVDYSKKYSDQESYEECRRRKLSLKSNELPPEVSQTLKQSSNDEVKIYCIEGTPLTISYASSLSDLREIGTNCLLDKSDTKHSFASVNDNSCTDSLDIDSKKDVELLHSNNQESSLSKDKEDVKEGKSVSFRNSTDISKASSPLMFSRSSSIGSLTSFEQQSIIDDRSSVSVFSALTSGLISPSDLPDSPGELMSPTLTDKDNSSKIDVTKIDSDNECENDDLGKKDEIHPKQTFLSDIQNEIADENHLPETKATDPLDLNKSCEDDNDVVAQRLDVSNNSLDEVFENPEYDDNASFSVKNEEFCSKSDNELDDDEILLQQCIELGMPDNSNETKKDLNVSKNICPPQAQNVPASNVIPVNKFSSKSDDELDSDDILLQQCIDLGTPSNLNEIKKDLKMLQKICPLHPENVPASHVMPVNEFSSKSDDELDDDDILLQQCIELGMPSNSNEIKKDLKVSQNICPPTTQNVPAPDVTSVNIESKILDASKSNEESDEDDELLQQCIQLGMPENKPNKGISNSDKFAKPVYSSHSCSYKPEKIVENQTCSKSDDDCDADEILLQQCIELGMPKKSSENVVSSLESKTVKCHSVNVKTNTSQHPFKDRNKSYQPPCPNTNSTTSASYQQYRMPSKVNYSVDMKHKQNIQHPSPAERMSRNEFSSKSDEQLDDDDVLLQQCIELGMPSNTNEIKKDSKVSRNICPPHPQKAPASNLMSVNQYPFKERSKSYQPPHSNTINIIPASYQQYRSPSKVCYNLKMNHKPNNVRLSSPAKKIPENVYRKSCATKSEADSDDSELLLQRVIEMGIPKDFSERKNLHCGVPRRSEFNAPQFTFHPNDMRDNCPDGISDGGDEDDAILEKCIRAGMPSPKLNHNSQNKLSYFHTKHLFQKQVTTRPSMPVINSESSKKCNSIGLPPNQPYASVHSSGSWLTSASFMEIDSMRVYHTEDTPVLSPTASVSDLSSLSINESFLNNSRNSDCSSESEDDDDELLRQCIRSGMPEAKRAVA